MLLYPLSMFIKRIWWRKYQKTFEYKQIIDETKLAQ